MKDLLRVWKEYCDDDFGDHNHTIGEQQLQGAESEVMDDENDGTL